MDITVEPLTEDDRSQWQQLYRAYADFYEMPMDQQILDRVWGWIFDQGNAFYCQVAKTDSGLLLGLMHFRAMPSPLRGATVGFLDDLYVSPEHRGSGVVDALFAALQQQADDRGWPFVRWITADDNYRGRGVYDKVANKTQWVTYQMAVE
ncbi:MAG: GNAT family N-acetyltransferase [Candidatus Pelagadaptatus aseana]|uniref:GNAT family N-acetyltransferase n=1 Tax=Candidatus Pelagadaptatus aseana TaxID=3120508 RepID=UPI0039B20EB1